MRRRALIRADCGGAAHELLIWLARPGQRLACTVGLTMTDDVCDAIATIPERAPTPAYDAGRQVRDGAWAADLTGVLDLAGWPKGMRVIARRERPHPGAQLRFSNDGGVIRTLRVPGTSPAGRWLPTRLPEIPWRRESSTAGTAGSIGSALQAAPAPAPAIRQDIDDRQNIDYIGGVTNPRDIVSAERVIHAPAAAIFDVIADPARHPEIDGSGTVLQARPGSSPRLSQGATFGMDMKRGVPYAMTSTVTEFDEGRLIAWSPKPASGRGARLAGRIWRYELEPADGGTRVRETWDISRDGLRFLLRHVAASRTRQDMTKSLERLDQLVTSGT